MGPSVIRIAGARQVGRSHRSTLTPCQDQVIVRSIDGAACIALADGAGSKSRSETGAKLACKYTVSIVLEKFDFLYEQIQSNPEVAVETMLTPIVAALHRYIRRKKETIDCLASTLLFVAYKDGRYIAGHVGDGAIGIRVNGVVSTLSTPENGEYANTTYFLTDDGAARHFRVYSGEASPGFGAIVMSDGTAESLFDRSANRLGVAADRMMDWSDRLPTKKMSKVLNLNLEQVFSKKSADDCSIAVMTVLAGDPPLDI